MDRAARYECSNKEVLLGVHKAGKATYLLFANNAQSKDNPRGLKHELIPAETEVKVPVKRAEQINENLIIRDVIHDVFRGTEVPVKDGKAKLRLAAGDGPAGCICLKHSSPTGCLS